MASLTEVKSLFQSAIGSTEPVSSSNKFEKHLLDQLADHFDESVIEYELLEQKYKQLQLENDQYLSHVCVY